MEVKEIREYQEKVRKEKFSEIGMVDEMEDELIGKLRCIKGTFSSI